MMDAKFRQRARILVTRSVCEWLLIGATPDEIRKFSIDNFAQAAEEFDDQTKQETFFDIHRREVDAALAFFAEPPTDKDQA